MNEIDREMGKFKNAVDALILLPPEEFRRRLEEREALAQEISDRFDQAISFTSEEARRFLNQPMTI